MERVFQHLAKTRDSRGSASFELLAFIISCVCFVIETNPCLIYLPHFSSAWLEIKVQSPVLQLELLVRTRPYAVPVFRGYCTSRGRDLTWAARIPSLIFLNAQFSLLCACRSSTKAPFVLRTAVRYTLLNKFLLKVNICHDPSYPLAESRNSRQPSSDSRHGMVSCAG